MRTTAVGIIALVILTSLASAQTAGTGTVIGTVTDPTGGVVPAAVVASAVTIALDGRVGLKVPSNDPSGSRRAMALAL